MVCKKQVRRNGAGVLYPAPRRLRVTFGQGGFDFGNGCDCLHEAACAGPRRLGSLTSLVQEKLFWSCPRAEQLSCRRCTGRGRHWFIPAGGHDGAVPGWRGICSVGFRRAEDEG
ncbi:hypothetical protein VFPBJ_03652 [Purpureocillium lilacinum]|uniref:Uncharacterized protein n=1 Tax=Purpureocillium lilacinum TaxID=33203 RepID=A0A179H3V3_PURLI|nr:hypothetical protein VFPBJ_03652 [Purpureocillium lilacinum]